MRLRGEKPEIKTFEGDSLGIQLRRRRRELGLRRTDAAERLGVSWKTLMWWEHDEREPSDRFYPAIIRYLGGEPWPVPETLGERLRAKRRRSGLSIDRAAVLMGVDEGTLGRWERGEWMPRLGVAKAKIAAFLA